MSSWVSVSSDSHFPLANLPFGVFSRKGSNDGPHCASALGEFAIDLYKLAEAGLLNDLGFDISVFFDPTLNRFMELERASWRATRMRLKELFDEANSGHPLATNTDLKNSVLIPFTDIQMHLPATIGDYTDFYSSRDHATNVGIMIRGKDNALQPNWLHLPVGYHGRASSVVVSGTDVIRPKGQTAVDKTDPTKGSAHTPCRLMDFELEMAFFVGGPANKLGEPVSMDNADERIFGAVVMNDWSARDLQTWEYVPLGPFTSKNFATSISPWCISLDALSEFACSSSSGAAQTDPKPLPYIDDPNYATGSYDINLDISIQGADDSEASIVSRSNLKHMYWNFKQQLVHHSVSGCPMRAGDLLGTGTISGPSEESLGCMLELSWRGTREVVLDKAKDTEVGNKRKFLKDGDVVNLVGYGNSTKGYKIGFGECSGKVLPATGTVESDVSATTTNTFDYKLFSYWRSTSSWRVRLAMALKGLDYSQEAIDLSKLVGNTTSMSVFHDTFVKETNPMAQVPLLECTASTDPNNKFRISQSLAIISFLEDNHKDKYLVYPKDVMIKARALEMAEIINSGIQPIQNLGLMRSIKTALIPNDEGAEAETADGRGVAKNAIVKGLAVVEDKVRQAQAAGKGPYAAGTFSPTIADICLVPQLFNANRFGVDLSAFPALTAVDGLCANHPAFVAAHPDKQPDAKL
jgi:fumarylacetoacetase